MLQAQLRLESSCGPLLCARLRPDARTRHSEPRASSESSMDGGATRERESMARRMLLLSAESPGGTHEDLDPDNLIFCVCRTRCGRRFACGRLARSVRL